MSPITGKSCRRRQNGTIYMEISIAERMHLLSGENAFDVLARAQLLEQDGRDIVHLEIGQPDFKTPRNIIDAACRAMDDGITGYTATPGFTHVREAIAEYCNIYKDIKATAEEIVIVPGGKPVIFFTMLAMIRPGDEVICPDPGFPIYESCIRFAGGIPVCLPILEENEFRMSVKDLKKRITEKTRLIIINSPANPTGGLLTREDIAAIADYIAGKGIYVLSDEIYDRIVFEGKPCSIASVPEMKDYTIVLDGLSKSYAMTGWRLGYGVMNRELAAHFSMLMVNSNSCAASFSQIAAVEALRGPQDSVSEMVSAFRKRRNFIVRALNEIPGISCLSPKGAFYVFPNIQKTGLCSEQFAERLLDEAGVAALSGTCFGRCGQGYLRLSCANSMENLERAACRIDKFVRTCL